MSHHIEFFVSTPLNSQISARDLNTNTGNTQERLSYVCNRRVLRKYEQGREMWYSQFLAIEVVPLDKCIFLETV